MSISDAAKAVASALGSQKYAVVGGAACTLLGSLRYTTDVDLVVLKGKTREARATFRESSMFVVEPRTAHTFYQSVEIEILTPPAVFKETFDENTPTVIVDEVHILPPVLILNAKCGSILTRATEEKKTTDSIDIQFLLTCLAQHRIRIVAADVPNINSAFYDWFTGLYGQPDLWTKAGYNTQTGEQ